MQREKAVRIKEEREKCEGEYALFGLSARHRTSPFQTCHGCLIGHKMNSVLKVQHKGTFLISLPTAFQLNF